MLKLKAKLKELNELKIIRARREREIIVKYYGKFDEDVRSRAILAEYFGPDMGIVVAFTIMMMLVLGMYLYLATMLPQGIAALISGLVFVGTMFLNRKNIENIGLIRMAKAREFERIVRWMRASERWIE